ncbi:MAG: SDR family oxidoreductase [Firmicutes bacterium]|nr:SDR family oxidoreductase [Bacillota bacterium]
MHEEWKIAGKVVVITGATAGIGLAAARELARRGAIVIGVGRSEARIAKAEKAIREAVPGARLAFECADLSSLKSLRGITERIGERLEEEADGALHILINNAGTFASWYTLTTDGFELQWAVNHLAPFYLTHAFLPYLCRAGEARIINVTSGSHRWARIHWADVGLRRCYHGLYAYKQSKLANLLSTFELERRLKKAGEKIGVYAADPGLVNTEIGLKGTSGLVRWFWSQRRLHGAPPEAGAATIVFLACAPELPEAVYWRNSRPYPASRFARRRDAARRLWELSERMCGLCSAEYGLYPD